MARDQLRLLSIVVVFALIAILPSGTTKFC